MIASTLHEIANRQHRLRLDRRRHGSGPAAALPIGRVAVLAATVIAAMILAAASFSGVRADPVIDHQAPTIEAAIGTVSTSAVPVTGVAAATSTPRSGPPAGTRHLPATAVRAEAGSLEPDLFLLGSWTVAYVFQVR